MEIKEDPRPRYLSREELKDAEAEHRASLEARCAGEAEKRAADAAAVRALAAEVASKGIPQKALDAARAKNVATMKAKLRRGGSGGA